MKNLLGFVLQTLLTWARMGQTRYIVIGFASAMLLICLLFQELAGALFYLAMIALAIYGNIADRPRV